MCYKNVAPLGLQYKIRTVLQECRPAGARIQNTYDSTRISPRWGSNTKYIRFYKNFTPLGLQYKIHTVLQEFRPAGARIQNTYDSTGISPRWGSNTKHIRFYKNFAPLGRTRIQKCILVAVLMFCISAPEERHSCRKQLIVQ